MSEVQHEILQNSSNEEYTGNEHSQGSNVEIDKEADEVEESVIQGENDGRKNRHLPVLHIQFIRHFHIILEYSGGKEHLLLWKGKYANFERGPTIYQYQMVEEHSSVHSITICKGSSYIAPLSLSFGINL